MRNPSVPLVDGAGNLALRSMMIPHGVMNENFQNPHGSRTAGYTNRHQAPISRL